MNSSVSVKINSRDNRTADFIELVNSEGFDEKLRVATENRASDEASELHKTLLPLVQIVGHKVKWSAIERKGTLGRLYAMYYFFSLLCIFGTILPSMRDSRLAIRLCNRSSGEDIQLPAIHLRTKMISDNPIAAAQVFDRIMRSFFSIIAGIPLDDFTGRRATVIGCFQNIDMIMWEPTGNYIPPMVLLKPKAHHHYIVIFIFLATLIIGY